MLVNLKAHELTEGEIDFVSLVKHGANRSPFKIIKMDDLPEAKTGLMDKITSFFGDEPTEVSAFFVKNQEVAAYKPVLEGAGFKTDDVTVLKDVTIFKQENFDGDADVSLIALDPNLGLALDRVVKQFSSYPMSTDFSENMGASAFFPGLHHAFEALVESVWNTLDTAVNLDEASGTIDKNLAAFKKHVSALVKNMPQSVIKMETELRSGIGGSNLSTVDGDLAKSGDKDMTKINEAMAGDLGGLNMTDESDAAALAKADATAAVATAAVEAEIVYLDDEGNEVTEAEFEKFGDMKKKGKKMKKDADGNLTPFEAEADDAEAAAEEVQKESPGDPVVMQTSDTGEVSRDEGLPAGYRAVEKSVMKFENGEMVEAIAKFLVNDETGDEVFVEYVEKTEDPDADVDELMTQLNIGEAPDLASLTAALAGPLDLIGKSLNQINARLDAQEQSTADLKKEQDELKKTAEAAVEKAEETTLVDTGYDLDQSFGLLNPNLDTSVVEKAEEKEDIFKGLCPELDRLETAFNSRRTA